MRSIKRVLSIVLSCLMLLSMVAVGTVSASAATLVEGDTLYLVPNANWKVDGARFAMYFFGTSGNAWASMEDSNNDGVYEGVVPAGTWSNVIFCRMSPNNNTNDWVNKWNQTGDLVWDGTNNCYTINEGQWDSGLNGGKWSYIDDEVKDTTASEEPATETTVTLTSAQGVFADTTKTVKVGDTFKVAVMLQADLAVQDGEFQTHFDSNALKVTAQEINLAGGYQSNIYESTQQTYNAVYLNFTDSETGYDFATEANLVVYTFEVLEATSAEETITVDCVAMTGMTKDNTGLKQTEYITNRNVIAEEGFALTAVFETEETTDPTESESTTPSESESTTPSESESTTPSESESTTPSESESTTPSESESTTPSDSTPTGLSKEYSIVGYIDGADVGFNGDYQNDPYIFNADGTVTATFAKDSYVFVKTTDDQNWFMASAYCTDTTVTLANTSTGTGEKMFVPAGTVTFTLVENADGTLTLSYAAAGETTPSESDTTPTTPSESDTTPTTPSESDTTPTIPSESDTTPAPAKDYCLFGYIGGKNYGCEEDNNNIGEYIFADGTLTATFDQTAYVAVKTTDNANWYMTDGWLGEVSEATLYATSITGENSNKLYVPAGTVTFTLVENADGSLTLSYTVAGETTPSESDTTPTTPSESDTTPTTPSESDTTPTIPSESDTTPTIPSESDTTPAPAKDYCLFGYIGGKNYGCEEDNNNIGEYIFADGTLTATFDQTAYVAVKTTDNANWYMTDGWLGEVSEATLYATSITGENSNKLYVPAGTVTFTLVENADGSLTLSYTVATETTPSESDTTPTTPSESDTTPTTPSESDTTPTTPSESDTTPTTPSESDTTPTTPSESDTTPTTPSESDTTPTTPSESDTTPTTPSESDTTPTTPSSSDTTPTTPTTKPTQPTTAAKKPYLNITSAKVKAGATVKLAVMDNVSGAKVKFSADDTSVVKVSGKGKVTALKKGNATITATVGSTKLTCKIKVTTNPKLTNTKGKKISKVTIGVGGKATKILISGKAAKLKNQYKSTAYVKVTGGKQKSFIKIKGLKAGKSTIEVKVNRSKTLKLKVTVK